MIRVVVCGEWPGDCWLCPLPRLRGDIATLADCERPGSICGPPCGDEPLPKLNARRPLPLPLPRVLEFELDPDDGESCD